MDENVPQELVEAGRGYEDFFVPAVFNSWTQHLVIGAGVREGSHVLDIACGTGVLARDALSISGTSGRVVGIDPAPGMLAAAREVEPGIEWILCGAESLEVEDETFDCVVSQFGMMFFQDLEKSAQEMFRVLKPGGRLAVAVWNSVEHNPATADKIAVLQEYVSTAAADALRLPYSLGDTDKVKGLFGSTGFANVDATTREEVARFPTTRHMIESELRGWLPLFDIHLSEEKINEVLAASDLRLSKYAGPSGEAVVPMSGHVITAQKP